MHSYQPIDAFLSAMDDSMYEAKNMHRLMQ